jgi:hypothetical protein
MMLFSNQWNQLLKTKPKFSGRGYADGKYYSQLIPSKVDGSTPLIMH